MDTDAENVERLFALIEQRVMAARPAATPDGEEPEGDAKST